MLFLLLLPILSGHAVIVNITKELIVPYNTFPYNHVCSLAQNQQTTDILATFQAGSGEDHPDLKIYSVLRSSINNSWGSPQVAVNRDGKCVMNANLYQSVNGTLFLVFHSGGSLTKPDQCSTHQWTGFVQRSDDFGSTWSAYEPLPKGVMGSVKNNCLLMSNQKVVCPTSIEGFELWMWVAAFDLTDDLFSSWEQTPPVYFFYSNVTNKLCQGVIQPTIYEAPANSGRIVALIRSGCNVLARAVSTDYGVTWPEFAESSEIPNPDAGVDGVNFLDQPDLGLLLFYNNSTSSRTPLSLAQSLDDGMTWSHIIDIETDPSGSFEYPYAIRDVSNPRVAHLCYTYGEPQGHSMMYVRVEFE